MNLADLVRFLTILQKKHEARNLFLLCEKQQRNFLKNVKNILVFILLLIVQNTGLNRK